METTGRATDPNSRSHASAIDTKQLIGQRICVELYGGLEGIRL